MSNSVLRIGFLSFVSYMLLVSAHAQDQGVPSNKIIPPSPTAAALGRYGDVPVSLYSGATNVSIPLYQIKTTKHVLDIGMSYSFQGLRPSEEAGWTGLGWSLRAGGVITREIRGLDDFSVNGYYNASALPSSDNNDEYTGQNSEEVYLNMQNVMTGRYDSEPDIYYYNFAGESGKFVVGKKTTSNGINAYVAESNSLKFEIVSNGANNLYEPNWIITDKNGYRYFFNNKEYTTDYSFSSPYPIDYQNDPTYSQRIINTLLQRSLAPPLISSWYLSQIVDPSGESIDFTYSDSNVEYTLGPVSIYEDHFKKVSYLLPPQVFTTSNIFTTSTFSCQSDLQGAFANHHFSRQLHAPIYLKRIDFKNGYILFNNPNSLHNTDLERQDIAYPSAETATLYALTPPKKLRNMEVFDKTDILVKKYVFDYSYFTLLNNSSEYPYIEAYNRRLKLDAITEYAGDGISHKPPFGFDYYFPSGFPTKNTKAIDWWGFYNGQTDNKTLLPQALIGAEKYEGGNRVPSINLDDVQTGALKSINYPTGARTDFQYELHRFKPSEYQLLVNEIVPETHFASNRVNATNFDDVSTYYLEGTSEVFTITPETIANQRDPIDGTQKEIIGVTYFTSYDCNWDVDMYTPLFTDYGCEILSSPQYATAPWGYLARWDDQNANTDNVATANEFITISPSGSCGPDIIYKWGANMAMGNRFVLKAGKYKLVSADLRSIHRSCGTVYLHFEYQSPVALDQNQTEQMGGGLRIKSIANYDNSKLTGFKKYNYTNEVVEGGATTGRLLLTPRFTAFKSFVDQNLQVIPIPDRAITITCLTEALYFQRNSSNINLPGFSANGSIVGYDKVTEIIGKLGEGGRTENYYRNSSNQVDLTPEVPVLTASDNGFLSKQIIRDKYLNKVKEINFDYTLLHSDHIKGVKVINFGWGRPWDSDTRENIFFTIKFYRNPSNWWGLTKKTETDYLSGNPISIESHYEYSNVGHKELTKEEMLQSDGSTLIHTYKRPSDYVNALDYSVFNTMGTKHIISPVVEQQSLARRGGRTSLIGGNLTKYKVLALTSGSTIVPETVYKLNLEAPLEQAAPSDFESKVVSGTLSMDQNYEPVLHLDSYNLEANLLEAHKPNDFKTVYVWGYDNTFPVAEIKNSDYATVSDVIGSTFLTNLNTLKPTNAQVKLWLSNLRADNRLKNAFVTTYTYLPLVGQTSATNERGVTTNYEYDIFNRLRLVRDDDNNIRKRYLYNYAQVTSEKLSFSFSPDNQDINTDVTFTVLDIEGVLEGDKIVTYTWQFDDGNVITTTSKVYKHSFTTCGVFNVGLQITVDGKQIKLPTQKVTIKGCGLSGDIVISTGTAERELTVYVANSAGNPPGTTYHWYFKYRDNTGTTVDANTPNVAPTTYADDPSKLTITLPYLGNVDVFVDIVHGASPTKTLSSTVLVPGNLTGSISRKTNGTSCTHCLCVEYTLGSIDSNPIDGGVTYVMDYGDGTVLTSPTFPALPHTYANYTPYNARLTIKYTGYADIVVKPDFQLNDCSILISSVKASNCVDSYNGERTLYVADADPTYTYTWNIYSQTGQNLTLVQSATGNSFQTTLPLNYAVVKLKATKGSFTSNEVSRTFYVSWPALDKISSIDQRDPSNPNLCYTLNTFTLPYVPATDTYWTYVTTSTSIATDPDCINTWEYVFHPDPSLGIIQPNVCGIHNIRTTVKDQCDNPVIVEDCAPVSCISGKLIINCE